LRLTAGAATVTATAATDTTPATDTAAIANLGSVVAVAVAVAVRCVVCHFQLDLLGSQQKIPHGIDALGPCGLQFRADGGLDPEGTTLSYRVPARRSFLGRVLEMRIDHPCLDVSIETNSSFRGVLPDDDCLGDGGGGSGGSGWVHGWCVYVHGVLVRFFVRSFFRSFVRFSVRSLK